MIKFKKGGSKFLLFLNQHWFKITAFLILIFASKPILNTIRTFFDGITDTTKKLTDQTGIVLDTLGIGISKGEEAFKKLSTMQNGYWSPLYAKSAPSTHRVLTTKAKQNIAKIIYDSWGFYSRDFEATIGAIKQLSAKSQVSDLAYFFQVKYNKDLLTFIRPANWTFSLRNYPTSEQFKLITDYTDNLKPY